jgi:hypothetical protein
MIRTLAKTYAYRKAPKTTFAVLHPKQAVKLRRLRWDIRHAYAPRVAALGALALAIPLGYAIGRKVGNGNGARLDD